MNFFGEVFDKYFSSEDDNTCGRISEPQLKQTVNYKKQSVTVASTESNPSNPSEGVMSSLVERFNRIVTTWRSSDADERPLFDLFAGSSAGSTNTGDGLRQRGFSTTIAESTSEFRGNSGGGSIVGALGCAQPTGTCVKRRSEPLGIMQSKMHGGETWRTFEGKGDSTKLRRSVASNKLNALGEKLSKDRRSVPRTSLSVENEAQNSIIEIPSINEEKEENDASSDAEHDEPSFMDKIRTNLRSLKRNIVIRHRRYKKREKREQLANYYRQKYSTNSKNSADAIEIEATASDETSTGVSRLFNFVRNKLSAQPESRSDLARKRVAIKMEKRRQLFRRQPRGEVISHIRKKYQAADKTK